MTNCAFCAIASGDRKAPIVFTDEHIVAFLDARPVFKGHVLVIPCAHYETLAEIPVDLVMPLFSLLQKISSVMSAALEVQGSFVGVNNTVGQSVPHLHVHPANRSSAMSGVSRGSSRGRRRLGQVPEAAGTSAGALTTYRGTRLGLQLRWS